MSELVLLANSTTIYATSVAYYANGSQRVDDQSYTSTTHVDVGYTSTTYVDAGYTSTTHNEVEY